MLADTPSRNSSAVREAASRARRLGRPVLASWTAPSSLEAISFFAQAASTLDRVLWLRPSSGEALVGVGTARTLTGSGVGRFRQVAQAWHDLVADAVVDGSGSFTSQPAAHCYWAASALTRSAAHPQRCGRDFPMRGWCSQSACSRCARAARG